MNAPPDPLKRLVEIAAAVGDLWLLEGIERHIIDGAPLDAALGLCGGQGRRTARTRHRLWMRDHYLALAKAAVPGPLGSIARAAAVDRACRKIESAWARIGAHTDPPERFTEVERAVFRARKYADALPGLSSIQKIGRRTISSD